MAELTTQDVKELLIGYRGQEITLDKIRSELQIQRGDKSFDAVRNIVFQLAEAKVLRYVSKGNYKVISPARQVQVFGVSRERRPFFPLIFPRDFDTGIELDFSKHVSMREGDLVTLGGKKSKGKTTLCMSFCGENIGMKPVLMGNEYSILIPGKDGVETFEPSPRFLSRMDTMSEWVDWVDDDGMDKFELLPVMGDYAEHVRKNRLNIIDWINLDAGRLYDIGKVLEGIKSNLGRGIAIIALQKGEGDNPRGGQFVRDFSDLEILLDGFGDSEDDVMLTVKGAKEKTAPVVGKHYVYTITGNGTKIVNFREVVQCGTCYGKGWEKKGNSSIPCFNCSRTGYIDK